MNEVEIRQAVVGVLQTIAPEADFDSLPANESLRDALDIDSFDFLNFVIGVHQKLAVEIPESDYGQLTTLDDVVRYVAVHSSGPNE